MVHFELIFCTWSEIRIQLQSSVSEYPGVLVPFVKKISVSILNILFFPNIYLFNFRERRREGEKERDIDVRNIVWLHPDRRLDPQPRHVP